MPNTRVRKINEVLVISGAGKRQSAFGAFMPNSDLDTREKCTVTITDNINRRVQRDCEDVDIIDEPITDRDTQVTLEYTDGFSIAQAARWLAYQQGTAGAPSGSAAHEVQTLTRSGTVSGGPFTLTFTHEGKTGVTEAIAYDATAATIQAALLKKTGTSTAMGKIFKAGDVTVSGTWGGGGIVITFGGRFGYTSVPLFTVNNTSITGGGSVAIAQTTAGSNKVHAISRSADGTLPLFSFISGDKNGTYNAFKYGDAVVDAITFNTQQTGGGVVTMTVTILCNYVPERITGFSFPACTNITAVKVADCKLVVDGSYVNSDLAALSMSINNNVPRDAAFSYDDIDVSNAFQRGDQPTQDIAASIYGTPSASVYTLAEAEETAGNEVATSLLLGQGTNGRLTIASSAAKVKFQSNRMGEAGALREKTININITPHVSPPLTYSAALNQSTTFLTASS